LNLSDDLTKLPAEFMPEIDALPGDLAQLAKIIDEVVPGMGVRIVLRLEKEYRGTGIYFHNLDGFRRRVRDAWVRSRADGGEKVKDIARDPRVGLCARQVWNILGTEPVDERQLKLF
jgi:Mor family transcriptional regulator